MTGTLTSFALVRRPRRWLLLAVVTGAAVRLYLMMTATVIARDGVVYVTMARRMMTDWRGEIAQDYPIGFPFLVLWAHRLIGGWLASDPILAWQRSGQLVCLFAGMASIPLVFIIARRLFGGGVALLSAWIWAMLPQAAALSADALTDMPHLALLLSGLYFLMHALKTKRMHAAVLCGAFAGCAYTMRTEGLELALVGMIAPMLTPRCTWARRLLLTACVAIGFSVVGGSYAWLEGGRLINKQRWIDETSQAVASPSSLDAIPTRQAGMSTIPRAAGEILEKLVITLNGVWLALALTAPLLVRIRRRRSWLAPGLLGLIHFVALCYLYDQAGYISGRHLLLLNVGFTLFAAVALIELARRVAPRIGLSPNRIVASTVVMIVACLSPRLLRDIHGGRDYIRQCAAMIRQLEGDKTPRGIIAPDGWVPFYAGAVYWEVCRNAAELSRASELPGARWLLMETQAPESVVAGVESLAFRELARFAANDKKRLLIVYEIIHTEMSPAL